MSTMLILIKSKTYQGVRDTLKELSEQNFDYGYLDARENYVEVEPLKDEYDCLAEVCDAIRDNTLE